MQGYKPPVRVLPSLRRATAAPGVRTQGGVVAKTTPKQTGAEPQNFGDLAKMFADFTQHAEAVKKMHDAIMGVHQNVGAAIGAIKQGAPGVPGRHGNDGRPGARGADAHVDEQRIAERVLGLIKIPKGKNGRDIDPQMVIEKIVEMLRGGELKIHAKNVEGLEETIAPVRNLAARGGIRGGGDTVVAGSNVTITTNGSGQKVISTPGGSISIIAITGTVDDSNKNFTALTQPTLLNINGAFYQKTGGAYTWSYSGGNITLNQPVGLGGQIFGI